MAHRKAGGTAKNLRDSNPKYLGTKLHDGQKAQAGSIIVRQRGTQTTSSSSRRHRQSTRALAKFRTACYRF